MNGILLRTLALGYGLALTAAAALAYAGASFVAVGLTAWLGGGVISFGLSALIAARTKAARNPAGDDTLDDALLAEAMRKWEIERISDQNAPARSDRAGAA